MLEILLRLLINYLLPVVYDSAVSLLLALFFLTIFRIRDSNIRILFLFLPLVKPFLVILEKVDVNKLYLESRVGTFGLRFPDPTNIIDRFEEFEHGPLIFSSASYVTLLLMILGIILVLIARWISLAMFYRKLAYEEKVDRKDVPEIYDIIDRYSKKIKIKPPDVSLTHKSYFSPFVVGIKNCTLVLSPKLIESLDKNEKEILIQHELSHIKRNDNLIGWIALILKDLQFFNPFSYIAYYLIKSEQERGSDKLVVQYSQKNQKEIARTFLSSIMKTKITSQPKICLGPLQSSSFSPATMISQKRLKNRINSIINTYPNKIYSNTLLKIFMSVVFLALLLIQIILILKIGERIIFLR